MWHNNRSSQEKNGKRQYSLQNIKGHINAVQSHNNSCLLLSHSDFLSQGSSFSIRRENVHWLGNYIGLWSECLCERVYYYMLFRVKLFINWEDEGLNCWMSLGTKSSWESWETLYSHFFHSHICVGSCSVII